jgi:hypothetical protein
MKKLFLALAFAGSIAVGLPYTANAKTVVHVYFGYPHYSYRVGPGYVYRPGYGWYYPGYRRNAVGKLTCYQAMLRVRNSGYHNISTVECGGSTYTFRATHNGNRRTIFVNSRSGAVWRG